MLKSYQSGPCQRLPLIHRTYHHLCLDVIFGISEVVDAAGQEYQETHHTGAPIIDDSRISV